MILAWQGWKIEIPGRWSPVKIEGDGSTGSLLLADMHRPRLGIRWKEEQGRRFDAAAVVAKTMISEVGALAAAEARPVDKDSSDWESQILFEDREPPGRDVWVGYSHKSRRLFEVVYHAHHRDRLFRERLLPTLVDYPDKREWSVFNLSCRITANMSLVRHRLNAGDLGLMFEGTQRQAVTVRQIAVAKLALLRQPMGKWIAEQASWRGNKFKLDQIPDNEANAPRLLRRKIVRRRQFAFMWWLARGYVILACHDEVRDRLILVDATDESLADEVIKSVGWTNAPD